MGQEMFRSRMAEFIKDKRLLEGFTPKFGVGCRRITPGDPYMVAIQEPNVDVHFTPVVSCTEDGVVGEDGTERKCDTIVCATGFDVSYRPRFPVVGKNGIDLKEKWKDCPESYLGLAVPDFPNMMLFVGPTWPVGECSRCLTFMRIRLSSIQRTGVLWDLSTLCQTTPFS
jgi:hydroxyversicolorone monooxygenase